MSTAICLITLVGLAGEPIIINPAHVVGVFESKVDGAAHVALTGRMTAVRGAPAEIAETIKKGCEK